MQSVQNGHCHVWKLITNQNDQKEKRRIRMRKIKGLKMMLMAFAVCCLVGMTTQEVFAKSVSEKGVHDTQETAMEIEANKANAVNAANGKTSTLYHVSGRVYSDEPDWYKVYLAKGTQYVSLNGDSVDVELYTADQKMVLRKSYTKTGFWFSAYPFVVETEGYYYVKITSVGSAASYYLSVGDPNYTAAECTVELNAVTMSSKQKNVYCDLRNINVLPDGAVVYSILMNDVENLAVSAIDVTNMSTGIKNNLGMYSWMKNRLESQNMFLKSRWKITFTRNNSVTFTPSITFYYVYPVTSTTVQNEIVIS